MAPGLIQIAGSTPHLNLRTAAMNQTLATLGLSGLLMLTTQARPQDGGTLVDLAVGHASLAALVDWAAAHAPDTTRLGLGPDPAFIAPIAHDDDAAASLCARLPN